MYKDSKRTCRTIVLPFTCKLLVWRRFRCRRRRDLLKLPSQFGRGAKRRKRLAIGVNLPSSPALPLLFFSRCGPYQPTARAWKRLHVSPMIGRGQSHPDSFQPDYHPKRFHLFLVLERGSRYRSWFARNTVTDCRITQIYIHLLFQIHDWLISVIEVFSALRWSHKSERKNEAKPIGRIQLADNQCPGFCYWWSLWAHVCFPLRLLILHKITSLLLFLRLRFFRL